MKRVYAYSQSVLQGASPNQPVEEGKYESGSILKSGKTNFFIYLIVRNKYEVYPSVLWIKGQGYEIKPDTITLLPVKIPGTDAAGKRGEIILVPETPGTVIMLTPGPQMNFFAPPEPRLQALLDANESVIEYRWNDVTCYFPIPKIKTLEAVAAE